MSFDPPLVQTPSLTDSQVCWAKKVEVVKKHFKFI